jgi:molybdopterin molybdotransferase
LGIKEDFFQVILDQDVSFAPNLIYFLEAKINIKESGTLSATPVKGNGSGDFANLLNADGFLILPQDQSKFKKGEVYPFIGYRKLNHTI